MLNDKYDEINNLNCNGESRGKLCIRTADVSDAAELRELYAPYVRKTAITFEYDVPDEQELASRISNTLKKYPFLVAEQNGEILGYAYTHAFVGRAAYDHAAETSIYVRENCHKCGVGKALYGCLEEISRRQNIFNLNACVAYSEADDEFLTNNSVQFHEHLGFKMVGRFHKCGYKFNKWYDMVWLEKIIGEHCEFPQGVKAFSEIDCADILCS